MDTNLDTTSPQNRLSTQKCNITELRNSPKMPTEKKITKRRTIWSDTLKLYFLFSKKLHKIPMEQLMTLATM